MKKKYIKPTSKTVTIQPVTMLDGSNFEKEDFGGVYEATEEVEVD